MCPQVIHICSCAHTAENQIFTKSFYLNNFCGSTRNSKIHYLSLTWCTLLTSRNHHAVSLQSICYLHQLIIASHKTPATREETFSFNFCLFWPHSIFYQQTNRGTPLGHIPTGTILFRTSDPHNNKFYLPRQENNTFSVVYIAHQSSCSLCSCQCQAEKRRAMKMNWMEMAECKSSNQEVPTLYFRDVVCDLF